VNTRTLGRTGLTVGEIGLGTEYLLNSSADVVAEVVQTAVRAGANYIDLLYNQIGFVAKFAPALAPVRQDVILAVHWGVGAKNGQLANVRTQRDCRHYFDLALGQEGIGYADIALLMMVDTIKQFDRWVPQSLRQIEPYRQQGLVRHIGLSSHKPEVALHAVASGLIDVLMYPVNPSSHLVAGNQELYCACAEQGVALVAMKPYAGGRLFDQAASLRLHWVHSGGQAMTVKQVASASAVQMLSYVLDQPGVATVVPGVKNLSELNAALAYSAATPQERDHSELLEIIRPQAEGECIYCNHCLPCPASINIGQVIHLFEQAQISDAASVRAAYASLARHASDCTVCGVCATRCPYAVEVVPTMQRVVGLFGS
jgi:hypothetical protein